MENNGDVSTRGEMLYSITRLSRTSRAVTSTPMKRRMSKIVDSSRRTMAQKKTSGVMWTVDCFSTRHNLSLLGRSV